MKSHNSGGMSAFYKPPKEVTEVRAGYLQKSPPLKLLTTEKSWKRRYFILFKLSETEYQLKYFRSKEENEKPLGEIKLSQISELHVSPQFHSKWSWIQKSFKSSPSCVLFIKTPEREYFLIGENSEDVDHWLSDLLDAMKNSPRKLGSSEELPNGQAIVEAPLKIRSQSDPSSNNLEITEKPEEQEDPKRRVSEPVHPIYEIPRPITQKDANRGEPRSGPRHSSVDSLCVTVTNIKLNEESDQPEDKEVAKVNTSTTLLRTVNQVFDKMKTQVSPLSPCAEETDAADNSKRWSTDSSSSSSTDHGAPSPEEILDTPEKQDSNESIDRDTEKKEKSLRRKITLTEVNGKESADHTTEERDIVVNQMDLKKHLSLTEVDGKPRVSAWTGHPQTVCVFHKDDLILAVNDLHISGVEEFNMFISKSLKNEVKVTILHHLGNQPLHLPNSACTDGVHNAD
ncbi:pleckstrin homology domain-containing family S member 1 [Archocentrus centrarchus]|uniref:pleckstrin homology domain-containing family S member 1 n=1 Tax=Archocentrus centrarchus TaxID=63155 RepID=UPI0011E9F45C|nr:pleckstrin homology domain-containing family S member 1 [Archocentrus centrarchus]